MAMTRQEHLEAAEKNLQTAQQKIDEYERRGGNSYFELARHYREMARVHAELSKGS